MEVDLFSIELKVAIEIDGQQHLSDPAAYRRDRRKDALLQENGCLVLRFLAEDLGKHLDATLDAILRAGPPAEDAEVSAGTGSARGGSGA